MANFGHLFRKFELALGAAQFVHEFLAFDQSRLKELGTQPASQKRFDHFGEMAQFIEFFPGRDPRSIVDDAKCPDRRAQPINRWPHERDRGEELEMRHGRNLRLLTVDRVLLQIFDNNLAAFVDRSRADRTFARYLARLEALPRLEPLPVGIDQRNIGRSRAKDSARSPDQGIEFVFGS